MTFYLRPVSGYMSLSDIENITIKRVKFLAEILKCEGDFTKVKDLVQNVTFVEGCESLLEGSKMDNVSHFMLRLICCEEPEMRQHVATSETLLFQYRFSCMNKVELYDFFKLLQKDLQHVDIKKLQIGFKEFSEILSVIAGLFNGNGICNLVDNYQSGCKKSCIQVPFTYVPSLVAERNVNLANGWAFIPSRELDSLMSSLFWQSMLCGYEMACTSRIDGDVRLMVLCRDVRKMFCMHGPLHDRNVESLLKKHLSVYKINDEQQLFPLCMRDHHQKLRKRHKLPHHSRIQYTLFLKEAGLLLHDAIHFWREEYMSPSVGTGGKSAAAWPGNERRYTYNIRHLYGLEGSRINIRSHSCKSLQRCLPTGGCPYKHFDKHNLKMTLKEEQLHDNVVDDIIHLVDQSHYKKACSLFLSSKLKKQFTFHINSHMDSSMKASKGDSVQDVLSNTSTDCVSSQWQNIGEMDKKKDNYTEEISCHQQYPKSGSEENVTSVQYSIPFCGNDVGYKYLLQTLHDSGFSTESSDCGFVNIRRPIDYFHIYTHLVNLLTRRKRSNNLCQNILLSY